MRRSRRKRSKSLLRYKQQAAIGIGATRKQRSAQKREHRNAIIKITRELVFARDGRCRFTRKASPTDQMHEVKSRAMLRGRPPEEIFTTENCIRLSREIHEKVTRNELRIIVLDPEKGCNGEVAFIDVATDFVEAVV